MTISMSPLKAPVSPMLVDPDTGRGREDYILFLRDLVRRTNLIIEELNGVVIGSGDVVGPASSANNNLAAFDGTTGKLLKDSGISISNVLTEAEAAAAYQPLDADLTALAALSTTGHVVRTGSATYALRTLTGPAAGITITDGNGVAGNPTIVLANDLAALEGLSTTGFPARTATDTYALRSLANATAGITWTNPAGVAGNPTPVLANDLAALEGLGSTGIAVRTTTDTWAQRSIAVPAAGISITNPAGIAGNPTLALADDLAALEALSGTNTIYYRSAASTWTAVTVGSALSFSGGTLNTEATLAALAAFNTNGLLTQTAADTFAGRTITGTAAEITVTNGNGVAGNPTLSLPAALTLTGKTMTGGTYASVVNTTYAAGTTAIAPINLVAGTNLTTPVAGAKEYDGTAFYASPVASSRAVDLAEHFLTLSANQTGTNVNTAQPWFPGGGATGLTVAASTSYFFDGFILFTKTAGTNARTVGVLFGGTATITSIFYDAVARTEDAANPTLGAVSFLPIAVATNTTVTASSASGNQSVSIRVRGIVRINAGGTFIPQFQYSAAPGGAPTVRANSWFKMIPVGSDSVLSVGNWS